MTDAGSACKGAASHARCHLQQLAGIHCLASVCAEHGPGCFIHRPRFWAALALLILWTAARTTLLSWADLSYVLPVTAIGYVLTLVTGMFSCMRRSLRCGAGAATLLVVAGVILAATTPAQTTHENEPR